MYSLNILIRFVRTCRKSDLCVTNVCRRILKMIEEKRRKLSRSLNKRVGQVTESKVGLNRNENRQKNPKKRKPQNEPNPVVDKEMKLESTVNCVKQKENEDIPSKPKVSTVQGVYSESPEPRNKESENNDIASASVQSIA
ncbi:hypothetical protein ACTXT7_010258 [Hymenolepis weldensis]